MKKSVLKQRKGAFSVQKTLQKFGYSVLKQMRALFSILRLLLSKMSKVRSDIALYCGYCVKILESIEKTICEYILRNIRTMGDPLGFLNLQFV